MQAFRSILPLCFARYRAGSLPAPRESILLGDILTRKRSKGRAAYSASKFGVIGLTRAAALDYAAKGIRINAVCPGIIGNTPMAERVTKNYDIDIIKAFVAAEPIGRLGEPEEIAAAVLWLCGPATSFVVGHSMVIDGGILTSLLAFTIDNVFYQEF